MESSPPPRRFAWKTLLLGALIGIGLGSVGLAALLLGSYAFFNQQAVKKIAESKELKPLLLRADFDWSVTDLQGNSVDMKQQLGKTTLLHFWNPTCVSCIAEIPGLNAFYDTFAPQGLSLVAVALHGEGDLAGDVAMHGIRFPVYAADRSDIPPVFNTHALPTTYLIDTEGFVTLHHTGAVDWTAGDAAAFLKRSLTP